MSILGDGNGQTGSEGQTGGEGNTNTAAGSTSSNPPTSWMESLPDELKNDSALQQFTDVQSLAKSYLSTKSMVGKKGVIVPGEKATDEEWSHFFKSIGQPEADKFDVKPPEGREVNQELVSKFKEMAHKSGLLPKQAQALFDWYLGFESETVSQASVKKDLATKEALDGLRKEWGEGYDKNLALGELAIADVGGEEFAKYLTETGLAKDPTIIKFLSKVGGLLGEDRIVGDGSGRFGQTPAEIEKEITDIMGNSNHPYFDRSHPSHSAAVKEMEIRYQKLSKATA